jgi:Xaa-Pro aminopeptidase
VDEARRAGIAAVRPGAKATDVDAAARGVIENAGFGKDFGHGLGHGIGLEVHESIRLSSISKDVLKPGMVFTIEPGVYLPGWGGVRIEDDVLVTRDGCEVLSTLSRDLEQVPLT